MLSRLRKSVPVLLLVGVLALGLGAWMSRGLTWDTTTAAVEHCVHHNSKKKPNSLTDAYVSCRVAWTSDGKNHTDIVDFDGRNDLAGTKREVAVHGDAAMAPGDAANGVLLIGLGVVLLGGGGVLLGRRGSTPAQS
jgi:hypothetical protein